MKKALVISLFLSLGLLPCAFAVTAADIKIFQEANKNYRDGKFPEAAQAYEALADQYPDEAVFFYNWGNALHRQSKLGPAIVAYERALAIEPRNGDIRGNLNYVRGLIQYRVEDKRNWYLKTAQEILGFFTEKEVLSLVLVTYFLLAFSWAFVLFFKTGNAVWGWKRQMLLLLSALLFLVGVAKNVQAHFIRDAIVITNEAQARSGPSDTDPIAFRLGEGLKVFVVDKREDWSRVFLVSGETGWIRSEQIAEVNS